MSDSRSVQLPSAGTRVIMFQLTFSEQSMQELNRLDTLQQMDLLEGISRLTPKDLKNPKGALGAFNRGGTTFYRIRAGDYRVYFEQTDEETLYSHYILHHNTIADIAFRNGMPVSEETLLEQKQSFWKYLESLGKDDG